MKTVYSRWCQTFKREISRSLGYKSNWNLTTFYEIDKLKSKTRAFAILCGLIEILHTALGPGTLHCKSWYYLYSDKRKLNGLAPT